jgi:hypothetical protein
MFLLTDSGVSPPWIRVECSVGSEPMVYAMIQPKVGFVALGAKAMIRNDQRCAPMGANGLPS